MPTSRIFLCFGRVVTGLLSWRGCFWALLACTLLASPATAAVSDEDFLALCEKGSAQQIMDAIQDGANVNARDRRGKTPLMRAAWDASNAEAAAALIKAGADVNASDDNGWTALMEATCSYDAKMPPPLIQAGADVHARNNNGSTALLVWPTCYEPNPEALTALVKAGADVNARNHNGSTALMEAARDNPDPFDRKATIPALLALGADPKTKDNSGKMAIDYARENVELQDTDVLKKLEEVSR
jgi:ankyrin repeat protein